MKTTSNKVETVHVADCEAVGLLFQDSEGRRQYAWGNYETSDVVGPAHLSAAVDEWGMSGGVWCVFYLEDCYCPAMYAFSGQTFEDAYEGFVDWHAGHCHGLKIDDADMKDYDADTLNFTSNGIPVDTESLRGFEVKLIEIRVGGAR